MPYIQLKTTDEQHKEIKLKAIESGKTIPEYVLECISGLPVDEQTYKVKDFTEQPTSSKQSEQAPKKEKKVYGYSKSKSLGKKK